MKDEEYFERNLGLLLVFVLAAMGKEKLKV